MHRKSLTRALDASLQLLGLDYIDLYYVHWWDFTTPVEEVQRALDDAVSAGKILHIGLSDVPAWVVSRAQAFHDLRGLAPVACMQLEYSLVQRSIEREHLPLARAHDIGVRSEEHTSELQSLMRISYAVCGLKKKKKKKKNNQNYTC